MPIGLGLHVAIALFFAVHAVRSGQERTWLFVLFAFPLLGSIVYALAIWLPEARGSRAGRRVARGVRTMLDPGRDLRAAQEAFDASPTTEHRLRLADALVDAGRPGEAVPLFEAALRGVHADDPDVQVRLARALLEGGRAGEARDLLDTLIRRLPEYRSQAGHLVYARAVAASGDRDRARMEFDALLPAFTGLEAHARFAEILDGWGDHAQAARVREESLQRARRMPRHAREINQEWIARLKAPTAR